jgi:hypothetical protein
VLVGTGNLERARLGVRDEDDSGLLRLVGQDGGNVVTATAFSPDAGNHGRIQVYGGADGEIGQLRGELRADPASDGGRLELRDAAGNPTIVLDGATGIITKSGLNGFRVPHPRDDRKEIVYGSLEGPEAGMYVRGTARVEGGRAVVKLPEHFAALARPGTLTVQLTPGSAETYGLAVVEKTPQQIAVRELGRGTGDFSFDYVVFAERADLEPVTVVRPRPAAERPAPIGDALDLAQLTAHRGVRQSELGEDETPKSLAELDRAAPPTLYATEETEVPAEAEVPAAEAAADVKGQEGAEDESDPADETEVSGSSEREEPDPEMGAEAGDQEGGR